MLDFLFQLGQLGSLLGLTAGFLLTVRYRKWVQEVHPAQSSITEINLLASIRQGNDQSVWSTASGAEPGERDTVAA